MVTIVIKMKSGYYQIFRLRRSLQDQLGFYNIDYFFPNEHYKNSVKARFTKFKNKTYYYKEV